MPSHVHLTLRGEELFQQQSHSISARTDRVFAWLMVVQYIAGVVWAAVLTPYTYAGSVAVIHPHLLSALVLGATIALPSAALGFFKSGSPNNKWVMSVCQMLMGALLIHLSGGRIETHFHVFCSLAFLALYRDWRVLIPATVVVAGDHVLRGFINPMSIYGIPSGAEFRFIEHAIWVVCEDVVLFASCQATVKEMKLVASRQADLEEVNEKVEALVDKRTAALRAAEFRYSEVIDNSIDGIILLDRSHNIVETNQAAEKMLGYQTQELENKPLSALFSADDWAQAEAFFAADEKHRERTEFRMLRGDRELIPVELGVTSVESAGEKTYVAFVRDLSQQRKLEGKLVQAQKMESIGNMAAGVAHEINTPNQYIGDNVRYVSESWSAVARLMEEYQSVLAETKLDDDKAANLKALEKRADLEFTAVEIPSALEQALEGVSRVENIIRAMKEFAHPGGGFEASVSLNKIIHNSCLISRNEWKYVADLQQDLDADLPLVSANSGELGQVVVNLVVNAAHAIKDADRGSAGLILVKTYSSEGFVVLEVSDNGVGIPEEIVTRVFEPFFTTKGVGIGTGQGLAITHSVIVDRHHGEIEMDSKVGEGTTIRIKLPIAIEEERAA